MVSETPLKVNSAESTSTREQLLDVAEALFLEHGVDGVSLRAIVRASGQKNQSALQYHFGGRDGLIMAILMRRADQLEAERRVLMEEALQAREQPDLRSMCAILIRAPFKLCREQKAFREFLGQFGQRLLASDQSVLTSAEVEHMPTRKVLRPMITASLSHLDPKLLMLRLEHAHAFGLLAISRRARSGASFKDAEAELFFNNLVDQIAGMLDAPVSPETRAQLEQHS